MVIDRVEKQQFFALASNGKSHSFDVNSKSDINLIEETHSLLLNHGFSDDEMDNMILSPTKPEKLAPAVAEAASSAVASVELLEPSAYPPIPKPENKDDFPPQKSSEILVSEHDIELFIYFWGNKGESRGAYAPAVGDKIKTDPPFPASSKIVYKRYWQNTGSYKLPGPQHFEKDIVTTQGMSKTNSTTLSAELGIEFKGLSAKLSKVTNTSITITEETSVTERYSFDVKDGSTVVYTLWQLVEEFALVDDANNPIEWKGRWGMPLPVFPAKFKENVFTNNSKRYASDPVKFKQKI